MLRKWGLLLWGQGGRGVTLATEIDLPPDLNNTSLIRHRDNFTVTICHDWTQV